MNMKVLISDDNVDFATTIADIVHTNGFETHLMHEPQATIDFLDKYHNKISVVMLDIEFGPEQSLTGIDILEHCRLNFPAIPVIMITGKATIDTAVKATKLGAVNFVEKSVVNKDKIKEVLTAAMERLGTAGEAQEIRKFLASQGIIGMSKSMIDVGDSIIRFGRTDLNVLISGETGTGKKLVARAIHAASRRAKYPFITVDIPNIPRELFQSELFGHNKGSFSGATDNKKGMFHQAHKGTLFLDEIGDMTLELQSNLFIPIEEKVIRRVGSTENETLDVRFISATDRDLLSAMKESKFREQLYHRLRECEIFLPPLKERREDIPGIVGFYAKKHNDQFNDQKVFSPASLEFLQERSWPGNVRELASAVRVVLQTTLRDKIEIADLHKVLNSTKGTAADEATELTLSKSRTLKEDLAQVDKKKIEDTLERCNGNVSKSAAQLGVSRETLHNKIRKYEINVQLYRVKKAKKA